MQQINIIDNSINIHTYDIAYVRYLSKGFMLEEVRVVIFFVLRA